MNCEPEVLCIFPNAYDANVTATFEVMPMIGNSINYVYMVIIFLFLVTWTTIMFKHKKNGEEHKSS